MKLNKYRSPAIIKIIYLVKYFIKIDQNIYNLNKNKQITQNNISTQVELKYLNKQSSLFNNFTTSNFFFQIFQYLKNTLNII